MTTVDRVVDEDLTINNLHNSYGSKSSIFKGLALNVQHGEFLLYAKYASPRSVVL